MKKFFTRACIFALTAAAAVIFAGCEIRPDRLFYKQTGIDLPRHSVISFMVTTGWFGDGEIIYIFQFDEENGQAMKNKVVNAEHWQPLPFSQTLDALVYQTFGGKIPRVESGYYFFFDEQNKRYYVPDDYIENSYSFDFVLCLYDDGSNTAYYYEQHT